MIDGEYSDQHCNSVRLSPINDVLITLYTVQNIEEAVRPGGLREILLSGKRIAKMIDMVGAIYISTKTTYGFNSFQ